MNGIHEVTGSIPVWSTNLNSFFRSDASTVLDGNDGHFVSSCTSRAHHHRDNRLSAARTGAILESISRADFALALRNAFQSPSAPWWRRSVK
jgi:hypothetical protein